MYNYSMQVMKRFENVTRYLAGITELQIVSKKERDDSIKQFGPTYIFFICIQELWGNACSGVLF